MRSCTILPLFLLIAIAIAITFSFSLSRGSTGADCRPPVADSLHHMQVYISDKEELDEGHHHHHHHGLTKRAVLALGHDGGDDYGDFEEPPSLPQVQHGPVVFHYKRRSPKHPPAKTRRRSRGHHKNQTKGRLR